MKILKMLNLIVITLILLFSNCINVSDKKITKDAYMKILIIRDNTLRYILEIKNNTITTEINDSSINIDYIAKNEIFNINQSSSKNKEYTILINGRKKLYTMNNRILDKKKFLLESNQINLIINTINQINKIKKTKFEIHKIKTDLGDLDMLDSCSDCLFYAIIITPKKTLILILAEIYLYNKEFQEIYKNVESIYKYSPIEIILFDKKREMEQLLPYRQKYGLE